MATEKWNSIDNHTVSPGDVYLAYMDVLGYKSKSQQFFSGGFNLQGRFNRALQTVRACLFQAGHLVDIERLNVRFFSDSIIVSHPKSEGGLTNILNATGLISANLSFEGLFIRGGISHGPHVEHGDGTLSSPYFLSSLALQKAYFIESQQAKYPRVIVDEEVINQISGFNGRFIVRNGSKFIVNFANYLVDDQASNAEPLIREIEEIRSKISDEQEESVKEKYLWLADYYIWSLYSRGCNSPIVEDGALIGRMRGFRAF